MRDFLFFPIAAAIMLGMIAAALAPGPDRVREALAAFGSPETGLGVSGETLNMLQMPDGLSMDLLTLEGTSTARIAAFRPYDQPPLSQGAFITLPPDFGRAFAGRTIRISTVVRRAPESGSPRFAMAYFGGGGVQDSGWQEMQPTDDLQTYEFDWTLPPDPGETDVDYIGVWPDPEGRGRAIDLTGLSARIVEPDAAEDIPAGLAASALQDPPELR